MAYTINFSDPSKLTSISVPDMPPGVNAVDTSLTLVGKGYPNYGQVMDQNFVKLLENFASSLPPENPIEGQLWYDTSNPSNKVLRIMDGTAGAVSWPSANGIYQQSSDPALNSSGLKSGDLWVDTTVNQIKIYSSGIWVGVGSPQAGAYNGPVSEIIKDTTGANHYVTKHYIQGTVVAITALEQFTPNPVIAGFSTLFAGINLFTSGIIAGTALAAANLVINKGLYSSASFLRKDDSTSPGQVITGRVTFSTPSTNSQAGSQGRDGVVINIAGQASTNYTQLYKYGANSILLNNQAGGNIVFQTVNSNSSLPNNTVSIADGILAINTVTSASSTNLDVFGTARISSTLVVNSTATTALHVAGGILVDGSASFGSTSYFTDDLYTDGQLYINHLDGSQAPLPGSGILPSVNNIYDIGSSAKQFRRVYATAVGSVGTQHYGVFNGPSTGLTNATTFRLQGQVTAADFTFAGTGTTATFNTTLSATAITAQQATTATTSTLTLLVVDTSTSATYTGLQRIDRDTLFGDLFPAGMIIANGNNIPPKGWLLCDGTQYTINQYPKLANALQYQGIGDFMYGGTPPYFKVPDMTTATSVTKVALTEPNYVNYIIKT